MSGSRPAGPDDRARDALKRADGLISAENQPLLADLLAQALSGDPAWVDRLAAATGRSPADIKRLLQEPGALAQLGNRVIQSQSGPEAERLRALFRQAGIPLDGKTT